MKMKWIVIKILFLSLFGQTPVLAADWSFVKVGEEYFLQSPDGLNHQVTTETGIPKITKLEDITQQTIKIEYLAGEAGTSQNIQIYRAALFNKKTNKLIGDYPSRYQGVESLIQPQWTLEKDQLSIKDENEGLDIKVNLNPKL